jgi:GT2 family glycosyltransferase
MKVAVVILNWNGIKFLKDFLPVIINYSKDDADIIIADNDSTDGSVEFLKQHFPALRIIQNKENGGFAKGYNEALIQVEHEFLILLNSDVEVSPQWIPPLLKCMEEDKNIAAAQPKMLDYFQRDHFEYAGAAGGFIDHLGYPFCRGRLFASLEKDSGQYNNTSEIFWATGACMVVRSSVFQELGGFDEEFFAHMEEIDLCWRMRNAGYKIMCCPESFVFHVGGGTLPKSNSRKTYLNFRNNLMTVYKNSPSKGLPALIFVRLILDGVAAFKFLLDGYPKAFIAVVRAHFYFYRTYGKQRQKRKLIQGKIKVQHHRLVYPESIVFKYYINGIKKFSSLLWN